MNCEYPASPSHNNFRSLISGSGKNPNENFREELNYLRETTPRHRRLREPNSHLAPDVPTLQPYTVSTGFLEPHPSIWTDSQGSPDTGEELLSKREKGHFMHPEKGVGDKGLKQKCRNSKDFQNTHIEDRHRA